MKSIINYLKTNPYLGPAYIVTFFILATISWKYFGPPQSIGAEMTSLMLLGLFVLVYFIILAFENIHKINRKELTYSQAIVAIICSVLWAIVFFGVVYLMIYKNIPNSFKGEIGEGLLTQILSFQYFSFLTFSLGGYGEIFPVSNWARLTVIMEIIYQFTIIIGIVGNFSNIKKRFKKKSPFS